MPPDSAGERALERELSLLATKLKRRQISGFHQTAPRAAELMRSVVVQTRWQTPAQLIERIQRVGAELVRAAPQELCIGNIVRRVLHIIREEVDGLMREQERGSSAGGAEPAHASATCSATPSLYNLLSADGAGEQVGGAEELSPTAVHEIKQPIIDGVNELIDELGSLIGNIAEQAPEHIHAREVILTLGRSRIVEAFLKRVAKTDRPFEVIVADTAPSYEGAEVARRLSEAGIQATLITDAAVFALMARINKVIIGTHAVMADGSLLAPAGTLAVALAAQHHSVPFVVCAGIPQLTPIFPTDADDLNLLLAPSPVLSYDETGDLDVDADVEGGAAQGGGFSADSPNPACDYVPPELISLFITNIGGTHASYIYRLLAEFYSPQDINLKALNPTQL
jgi:translation initiation factor eIF-2B subunit beta